MSDSRPNIRSIIESSKAEKQKDDASATYSRFEDAWLGFTWRLVRGPEAGVLVGKGHSVMKFPSFKRLDIDLPSVTILYSYDEHNVHIEALLITVDDD